MVVFKELYMSVKSLSVPGPAVTEMMTCMFLMFSDKMSEADVKYQERKLTDL